MTGAGSGRTLSLWHLRPEGKQWHCSLVACGSTSNPNVQMDMRFLERKFTPSLCPQNVHKYYSFCGLISGNFPLQANFFPNYSLLSIHTSEWPLWVGGEAAQTKPARPVEGDRRIWVLPKHVTSLRFSGWVTWGEMHVFSCLGWLISKVRTLVSKERPQCLLVLWK